MRDARKPQYDYAAEADIRTACDAAGVREVAQDDFIQEFRTGYFDRKGIGEWIAQRRADKPQRWVIAGAENDELYVRAFGPEANLTARGEVVKLVGEKRAAEIAAQFRTTLGSTKPGTVPEHIKTETNGSNPFQGLRDAQGNVDPVKAAKVDSLIKSLGTKKAEAIARSVGRTISGLPLRA